MEKQHKIILQKGKGKTRKKAKFQYLYEQESLYFAQVSESIKDLAVKEFKDLGASEVRTVFRGFWFKAVRQDVYNIIYVSRFASRILAPLVRFECHDKDQIYKAAKGIKWEEFLSHKKTFSIEANVADSNITHSNFAGLRVKDAIADYFRDRTNRRPNVDPKDPYVIFNVHVLKNQGMISMDASGGPLHKRGYREETIAGPMHETIAASIIELSGWNGSQPLYDPMCGSGTLLCEALMKYCRIPAQIFRKEFGFEKLPDFDAGLWEKIKKQALENIAAIENGLISGSDISENSINAAKTNILGLHHGGKVALEQKDFDEIDSLENHLIVANPPYGIRMGRGEDLNALYKNLGQFLKSKCRGSKVFIYFGDPKYIKKLPLAPSWKRPLKMGGLEGKLVRYDLF